jgi:hypothetical protein
MSGPSTLATIPVQVELSLPTRTDWSDAVAEELERGVAAGLAETVERLDVAGQPVVEVRPRGAGRVVRVRVHGSPVPYRAALPRRAWRMAAPAGLQDLPAQAQPVDGGTPDAWLETYLADVGEPELGAVVGYLVRLVVEAVRERAGCLAGPAQAIAHFGVDDPDALAVLRVALDEGYRLDGSADLVLRLLAAARELGRPLDETIEVVRAQVASPRLEVHLDPGMSDLLLPKGGRTASRAAEATQSLLAVVSSIEERVANDYGVRLPKLGWTSDPQVPAGCLALKVNEHLSPPVPTHAGGADLWPLGLAVETALYEEAARVVDRFVNIDGVEEDLARLEGLFPDLVRATVRRFRVTTLTRLLRALLREDVSVRDLRNLMERLLRFDVVPVDQSAYEVFDWRLPVAPGHGWPGPGWPDYLRWVRRESRDLLSARYAEDGAIAVMVLAPELERMAAAADNGRTSVNEAAIEAIRDAVWSTVGGVPTGRKPPLLTQEPVRAAVRRILAPELPDLPVLARSELWPHLEVRQLAVVTPR